jgi:nucleoside-diphosphate-sugar epimerase
MENLVLGSEGFVGRYLCDYLQRKGEGVVRFDIKRSHSEDVRFVPLPLKSVDKVYFLAWDVGGAKYLYRGDNQLHQLKWNMAILQNVMPQLEESKVPFVFTSSQLAEENTVYGVTKKLGEFWTQQIGGCFIRLCNVYGSNEVTSERSHVVSDFMNQARVGKIQMLSSGQERRQFLHLEDACDALYRISNSWVSIKDVADIVQKVVLEEGIRRMV